MTLQLEYTGTRAELEEAKSLDLPRLAGGGPKWRSRLIYWAFIALLAGGLLLRFRQEIAPKDRPWFIALVVVAFIALQFFKRLTHRNQDGPTRLEVSAQELVFSGGNGRTVMPWSAFSQCLESPSLFVLLDRPKRALYAVPKRAFPDEKALDWFQTLANQLEKMSVSPMSAAVAPGKVAAKGITLTVQLGYRDYLTRMVTSWRMKGVALGLLVMAAAMCLVQSDPPDAVNSRGRTLAIMVAMMVPTFAVALFVVAFISWRSEKKLYQPQQVAFSSDGIQFADGEASGLLAWSAYRYYLENRWAFFVWNPQGSLWMMFPKRAFASPLDVEQCRDLLRTNLKASRWFYL